MQAGFLGALVCCRADVSGIFEVLRTDTVAAMQLPFSIPRLLILLGWVYICIYFVARVQFSPLVSRGHKAIVNTFTILFGPIPLFIALILSLAREISNSQLPTFLQLKNKMSNLRSSMKISGLMSFKDRYSIRLLDSSGRSITEIYGHGKRSRKSAGVLNLTEQIVFNALEEKASDILIDPKDETVYTVRFRVDGVLWEVENIEPNTCKAVINSIKAVSNMDIAEKRRPQDGAFLAKTSTGTTSFRVASAGALSGEKLSIRVLNQDAGIFTLDNIGLAKEQKGLIKEAITKPSGMILMCGPTGSGKTTTLYAMLNEIDRFTRNVITVEDPIEYILPNASQIEVNPKAGITFANTLRSILRQDPDVICVGEIRDEETAAIALRAAQTGHLVLATVHCGSPAAAVIRLMDLGVSRMLLSSGLGLLVSQRLLRRLCNNCKIPAKYTQEQIEKMRKQNIDIDVNNIFEGLGCEQCHYTGYRRRIGIFDVLLADSQFKATITNEKLSASELRRQGETRGIAKLQREGLKKVGEGITSLEELSRVVG